MEIITLIGADGGGLLNKSIRKMHNSVMFLLLTKIEKNLLYSIIKNKTNITRILTL